MTREEIIMEVEKIRERGYVDYTVQSQHALDIVIEKFKTEKPKGHWVADFYEKNWETKYYNWHCSECGAEFGDSRPIWNYCPNYGADMRGEKTNDEY